MYAKQCGKVEEFLQDDSKDASLINGSFPDSTLTKISVVQENVNQQDKLS
jgi:hypothetical protein